MKNNKGFAISGMLYGILILFLVLVFSILSLLSTRKFLVDKLKQEVLEKLHSEDFENNQKIDSSGASVPEISNNMIPITYDENEKRWVKASYESEYNQNWYNYSEKKWANAVTVTEASREKYLYAEAGEPIMEADILTYFVWVPRFRYQLFSEVSEIQVKDSLDSNVQIISIAFEGKTDPKSFGTHKDEWLTHPAFTFGDKEVNGFWVGKFAASNLEKVNINDPAKEITIKPNVPSFRGIQIANAFLASQEMTKSNNIYGFSSTMDSHVMKNMEWGAIAYLSSSIYGKEEEIRNNNSSTYTTGCAASVQNGAEFSGCQNAYDTEIGVLASTTGNIYGIYDMSGFWQYVMGVLAEEEGTPMSGLTENGNSGFAGKIASGTSVEGIPFPESKYYDLYAYGITFQELEDYKRGKLGDATLELGNFSKGKSSWYESTARILSNTGIWLVRGGKAISPSNIFVFDRYNGDSAENISFRVVLLES